MSSTQYSTQPQQAQTEVKPPVGGEQPAPKYQPHLAAGHMTPEQLQMVLPNDIIAQWNDETILEDPLETTKELLRCHGVRVSIVPPLDSASKTPRVPNTLRTTKDIVLASESMIYGLDYPGHLWDQGADVMDEKPPVCTQLLFMNVAHNVTTTVGSPSDNNCFLLCYSRNSSRPLFIIERPVKDHFKFLKVYDSTYNFIGRVEVSSGFLKKKILVYGSDEQHVLWNMKNYQMFGGSDIFIRETKQRDGLITKRFTEKTTKEGHVGFDCLFPSNANFEQRCVLMAAAIYMDNLWFDKKWLSNIGV